MIPSGPGNLPFAMSNNSLVRSFKLGGLSSVEIISYDNREVSANTGYNFFGFFGFALAQILIPFDNSPELTEEAKASWLESPCTL